MSNDLEETLREAASLGDIETVRKLIAQNVDVNSKNSTNGWTALHWACKRSHEEVARMLLNNGADSKVENAKGERPLQLCSQPALAALFGGGSPPLKSFYSEEVGTKFIPNYIKNAPLNDHVDLPPRLRSRHDLTALPTTNLPSQTDDLVLKIRVAGSCDPDFIEVELPRWKLTYGALMTVCCQELEVSEAHVERIRKLPNTRLRKDNDVKRLTDSDCLEVVLKGPAGYEKPSNVYQSISSFRDQTILY